MVGAEGPKVLTLIEGLCFDLIYFLLLHFFAALFVYKIQHGLVWIEQTWFEQSRAILCDVEAHESCRVFVSKGDPNVKEMKKYACYYPDIYFNQKFQPECWF